MTAMLTDAGFWGWTLLGALLAWAILAPLTALPVAAMIRHGLARPTPPHIGERLRTVQSEREQS